MHWLGKDFLLEAVLPDGSRRTLIKIDNWDFNWQGTYEFAEEVALPKGTRIEMAAHFDNSKDNPRNPSKPPVEVHWGEQTFDEMCIGFLQLTRDDERLENRAAHAFAPKSTRINGAIAGPTLTLLKPLAGQPRVVAIDIKRDGRAEVGFGVRRIAPVSTALAPEVQGRRPVDRVRAQLEIAAPAFLTLLMVASLTSRHAQVVEDSAACARVARKFG